MKKKKNYQDFKISDLPKNRKELFFDILKNQWNIIFIMAFIIMLCFLPYVIYRYYNLIVINNIIAKKADNYVVEIKNTYFIYNAINILLFLFIGFVFSGITTIYKKMSFNDGFFLGADFLKGIKINIKDFLILFLLYGFINFILEALSINYLFSNSFLYYFFKILNYGLFVPQLLISMWVSSIYSDPLFSKIKLSIFIYFKHLPKIILAYFILILPLFLLLIPLTFMQLFFIILYTLIYFPFAYLVFVIALNYILDKEINIKQFPSLYKKGMYKEN